jgi:crotonobetainyl-CoA:carnitine CoA-transferase CaiB-like acyl-CoA transferase
VESSLLEGQVSWLTYHAVSYFGTGQVPERIGSAHASVAPYGAYPTGDGFLVIAVASDALWRRFCQAIGHAELLEDARFSTNAARCASRDELDAVLIPILAEDDSRSWAERMDAAGVPSSPVNTIDTVLSLPQIAHREMVIETPRDEIPDLRLPGIAIKLDETPGSIRRPPPLLGEQTGEVLAQFGYTEEEIARFRAAGIV